MLESEARPLPWHSALGWLWERGAIPGREPTKLFNPFSLSCPRGTDMPVLLAGQWLVCFSVGHRPWQRACRSLVTNTPAWTPGRSNSTSTRKTFKWQRGWCPRGQDPDCTASSLSKARPRINICACTEAKLDTARYSVSMRNSTFKDCCLPVLVFRGSSWSKWPCSCTQPLTGKAEPCSVMLLEQQEAVGAQQVGQNPWMGMGHGHPCRCQEPNVPLTV